MVNNCFSPHGFFSWKNFSSKFLKFFESFWENFLLTCWIRFAVEVEEDGDDAGRSQNLFFKIKQRQFYWVIFDWFFYSVKSISRDEAGNKKEPKTKSNNPFLTPNFLSRQSITETLKHKKIKLFCFCLFLILFFTNILVGLSFEHFFCFCRASVFESNIRGIFAGMRDGLRWKRNEQNWARHFEKSSGFSTSLPLVIGSMAEACCSIRKFFSCSCKFCCCCCRASCRACRSDEFKLWSEDGSDIWVCTSVFWALRAVS